MAGMGESEYQPKNNQLKVQLKEKTLIFESISEINGLFKTDI